MAADTIEDRYQVIGAVDDTTDVISSSGVGATTMPTADAMGTHFPIAGVASGTPAPLGGFTIGFDGGYA